MRKLLRDFIDILCVLKYDDSLRVQSMGKNFDCVDGNMLTIMYDNSIKRIKDVKPGDAVYSVQYDGQSYRYIRGEVTEINKRRSKAIKITLKDGRSLICSPNHQWLTQSGWLFTYDEGNSDPDKLFLKENLKMSGITGDLYKVFDETKLYMQGYFVGTEIYGKNLVNFKGGDIAEFVLQRPNVAVRMYNYLLYLGADATLEDCFAHDNNTNEYYVTKKINLSYKQLITISEKCSKNKDKEEFIRGFVAGVYDSDGSVDPIVKNVRSTKRQFLDIMKKGLDSYDFEYIYDTKDMTAKLLGGPSELLRFYNIFNPVTCSNLENLDITNKYLDRIMIVSIEEVKCDDLVEITTSSRNFFANGIISHNCTTGMVKEV